MKIILAVVLFLCLFCQLSFGEGYVFQKDSKFSRGINYTCNVDDVAIGKPILPGEKVFSVTEFKWDDNRSNKVCSRDEFDVYYDNTEEDSAKLIWKRTFSVSWDPDGKHQNFSEYSTTNNYELTPSRHLTARFSNADVIVTAMIDDKNRIIIKNVSQ